jgi:N,N'-diacetylchitobiose transport system permease protein
MSTTAVEPPGTHPPAGPDETEPKKNLLALWLLLPASALLLMVLGWPIYKMIVLSLQQARLKDITRGTEAWNNFANYTKILSDGQFWDVVVRTLVFTAACVIATMLLGTLVALLLVRLGTKMRLFALVGMLLAWATPAVTATQVWQFIFDAKFGIVNYWLVSMGLEDFRNYSWLAEPFSLLTVAGLIVVWGGIPFIALSLYAGLSQIPGDIYEAADVDGANAWTKFWKMTFPLMGPIFLILTALSTIWDFRVFTQVFILQKAGGIARETDLLGIYAYRQSFSANDFGVGSAVGVIMVIMLLGVSVFYIKRMINQLEEA